MKRRALGKTGEELSLVGLGGIVVSELPQAEADRIVAEAVDRGVNYFDVAPTYGDAQDRLGPALEPYRSKAFLACKTAERSKAGSARDLDDSLRKLRTDHVDLYQLHGFTSVEEVEQVFGPDGAMETFQAAKQAGKVRFIGFSAHSEAAALVALDRFAFDSMLFPLNFACWYNGFGPKALEGAKSKGAARLALKAMAHTSWPEGGERKWKKCWYQPFDRWEEAELAVRWTLSQEVTATVPPGEPDLFRMALGVAEKFYPLSVEEVDQLRAMARTITPIFST